MSVWVTGGSFRAHAKTGRRMVIHKQAGCVSVKSALGWLPLVNLTGVTYKKCNYCYREELSENMPRSSRRPNAIRNNSRLITPVTHSDVVAGKCNTVALTDRCPKCRRALSAGTNCKHCGTLFNRTKQLAYILLGLLLLLPGVVRADDPTEWTATDTALQVVTLALFELDREQTQYIAKSEPQLVGLVATAQGPAYQYKNAYYETNSAIGQKAHPDRINLYFGVGAALHTGIAVGLPYAVKALGGSDELARWSRTAWQSVWIVAEGHTVAKNYAIGVKREF